MLGWLLRQFGRAAKKRPDRHVVMYCRADCPLCDVAWRQLEAEQARYGFLLNKVDIAGDAQLLREHGDWVPVVAINGQVRFRGRINAVLLRRILEHDDLVKRI